MDIILDCVGAPYLERNMTCLATDGCVVYIGWMGGKALTCLCTYRLSPSLFNLALVCSGGGAMLGGVEAAFQLSLLERRGVVVLLQVWLLGKGRTGRHCCELSRSLVDAMLHGSSLSWKHAWCILSAFWAAAGMVAEKVDLMPLLRKRASLIGSTLRSRSLDFKAALVRNLSEDFKTELKQGSIKPPIDKVYPWESVADAHARMAASHHFGKILLSMKAT